MVGVAITAVNIGTQDTYTTTTNSDGDYTIEFVKVGTYRIVAKHPGFETFTKDGVTVDYNQTVRTDFSLPVGQVSQNIEVTATTPPMATDDASVREVIAQQAVNDLPLNGRDPLQLATTTPGVLPGQKAANGVPPGEDFIGAGTREIQNSISLDGIAIMNNLITTVPYHPSPDAIQEVEVQTGTYSAQYGAYLGLHMNLISKSGTNQIHGAAYEFFRNDVLDARNFFLSPTARKAPLRQNQFGFEVGGPVWIPKLYNGRDKTFFMVDYEGLRLVKDVTSLDTVLTPAMRQGNFSQYPTQLKAVNGQAFPGNMIPPALLSPQAQRALQYMPLPNLPGITNNLSASYPNNDRYNQTIDRIDQNIGNNIRLFYRYAWNNEQILTGATSVYNETVLPVSTRNWVFGYTQTLSANMVNDFRVGRQHLVTNALNYWYANNQANAGTSLGIPGFTGDTSFNDPGIPVFSDTGFMSLGNSGTNWFQFDTTWQGTDSFTWTRGAHTLIFGAELRKLITSRSAVNNPDGIFSFTGAFTGYAQADFILGLPLNDTTPGPEIRNQVAEWRDGFFVVDNWHATKKLTLNLGLRYELPTVPYTVNGYATILNPQQTALIPQNPPVPGFELILPNHKDFAPRVGLAYRLTDKTVFRAGYGIYYNPNQTNTFTFLSTNPPFSAVTTCSSTSSSPLISLNAPTPASACGTASIFNVVSPNPHLPTEYMNQWSADIERGLWANAALDVSYLGSHSTHLDRSFYDNTPLVPGPGTVASRRPNKLFGDIRIIQNDEEANYNGLSIILRQRLTRGFSMLASYTWSHDLDVTTDSNGGGAPMNPYNWHADYANSNWDVRHRFVAWFDYALPFFISSPHAFLRETIGGWQTNAIVDLQTGFPFNVVQSGDPANTGRSNERPNLVGTPSANCGDGHLTGCINAAAFQAVTFAYGNAGRNLLYGPGLYNVDFSAFKNFPIAERAKLQFRSEFFNLFNTPAFNNPSATLGTTSFGSITSTKHDNRVIQFALKLSF
jgi:outer membrane receptor protein involved in Fe transport